MDFSLSTGNPQSLVPILYLFPYECAQYLSSSSFQSTYPPLTSHEPKFNPHSQSQVMMLLRLLCCSKDVCVVVECRKHYSHFCCRTTSFAQRTLLEMHLQKFLGKILDKTLVSAVLLTNPLSSSASSSIKLLHSLLSLIKLNKSFNLEKCFCSLI